MAVPAFELRQQPCQVRLWVGIGDGLGKVIAGYCLAIVAREVQAQALGKTDASNQGLHHAHHFGTFFVNGDGVEVVDLDVAVRPHRVRHGAGVFGELGGAQHPNVFNAFDRPGRGGGAQILGKLLIPEHRQALLEAELKPVLAGDSVACPVVEILVPHHAFDVGVVGVCGGGRVGQHIFGVENVQALVLHGAHVEVAGGHDHEALQVQLQAEAGLVPGHRGHERVHGMLGFVHVASPDIDLQHMFFAGARQDALLAAHQLACHQRKQVAGFFVRVDPGGKVAALVARPLQRALRHQVAVGQKHGVLLPVSPQGNGVAGHHVRAVQKIGNAPKTLGLTLGKKRTLAQIQTGQASVFGGCAGGKYLQLKAALGGQAVQHQLLVLDLEGGSLAVDQHAGQVEVFAVEFERLGRHIGVAAQHHFVEHPGFGGVQVKTQVDRVHPVGRGGVIGAADHCGRAGAITKLQHTRSPKSLNSSGQGNGSRWR